MWGAVHWRSVWLGLAAGSLLAGLTFGIGYLLVAGRPDPTARGLALTASILAGLSGAGFLAGRTAPLQPRFHGSLAGLGIALVVVVVSRMGGSPAPVGQVLWLAALAIILGGLFGWWGGRHPVNRRPSR